MTVIVAARFDGRTVVGADTQTSKGPDRKGVTAKDFTKIIQTPYACIGFAGLGKAFTIVEAMLADGKYQKTAKSYLKFRNQSDAIKFSRDAWSILKDEVESAFTPYPEDALAAEMLIASNSGIYRINTYDDISSSDTFESIGSGEDVAIGAMDILYGMVEQGLMDIGTATKKAVETACKYSMSCGGAVQVRTVA